MISLSILWKNVFDRRTIPLIMINRYVLAILIFGFFIIGCQRQVDNTSLPNSVGLVDVKPTLESATEIPTEIADATAVSTATALETPTAIATAVSTPLPHCTDGVPAANPDEPALQYSVQIVNQYPHDPAAFTQGFLYLNGEFYEGTGLRGQSTVRRVDIETGIVQRGRANFENEFGEGTAVFNDKLYQLTWQSQQGYMYTLDDIEQIGTFSYVGEGWGLTSNGRCLIMSNGSNQITYRDPETFAIIGTLAVFDNATPITQLNELEFIDGEIWANIWQTNKIARISPETGQVLGWIDVTPLVESVQPTHPQAVPNGIAYDGVNGRVFLTGKLWPTIFEVELEEK